MRPVLPRARHVAAALSLVLLAASAHAADLLDEVRQRGTLRVAVEGTYRSTSRTPAAS